MLPIANTWKKAKMTELRVRRVQSGQTKIRNVPIAVTPEGFWCCPSPAAFQKTPKTHNHPTKQKASPPSSPAPSSRTSTQKIQTPKKEKEQVSTASGCIGSSEDQKCVTSETSIVPVASVRTPNPIVENLQRKVSVGFGQPETSDLKVVLSGKEGIFVRMSVHRKVLMEQSTFFSSRLSAQDSVPSVEIGDCDDVEIYVETVGLMYCKEIKLRLIKQSVPRVLRILKVAESLGFHACMKSCLAYLEAAPWVGEEEESVLLSVRHLQNDSIGISPILKRVSSEICNMPNDTLARIIELVLKSNEEKGRREMKSLVLKLLRENSLLISGSMDICIDTLYGSCRSCLETLLLLFREAAEPGFGDKALGSKDSVVRQISLEADNLLWLVEIMADRHVADEFVVMWVNQVELAALHGKLPSVSRHLVSCVTGRLFVGVGRGEMLPSKYTRQMLLQVWLQPLMDDYNWLQHGCRTFDQKVVEEGIGRTILTLPLEDQQNLLLSWLGNFLKAGDRCPNLQRAFEVWWRRTFIRPYMEQQQNLLQTVHCLRPE